MPAHPNPGMPVYIPMGATVTVGFVLSQTEGNLSHCLDGSATSIEVSEIHLESTRAHGRTWRHRIRSAATARWYSKYSQSAGYGGFSEQRKTYKEWGRWT